MGNEKPQPIRIFLDTCVLLDFLIKERKNEVSKFILRQLDGKSIVGVYSSFSLLELKDQSYAYSDSIIKFKDGMTPDEIVRTRQNRIMEITHRKKDDDEINDFLNLKKRKIKLSTVTDNNKIWERALLLMTKVNISAPDALLLSNALFNQSDIFVSKDKALISAIRELGAEANIKTLFYKKDTTSEDFQKKFNKTIAEIQLPDIERDDEEVIQFFSSISSIVTKSGFDTEKYEKRILDGEE